MSIGQRLKEFAKERFSTLHSFAEAMGIKLPGLYDYFNDRSLPGTNMLLKLNSLGCDIVWLLTGLDSETKKKRLDITLLGKRIGIICDNLNISITELAKLVYHNIYKCDVNDDEFYAKRAEKWVLGHVESGEELVYLAEIGQVNIYWLITGNENYYNLIMKHLTIEESELINLVRKRPEIISILLKLLDNHDEFKSSSVS